MAMTCLSPKIHTLTTVALSNTAARTPLAWKGEAQDISRFHMTEIAASTKLPWSTPVTRIQKFQAAWS